MTTDSKAELQNLLDRLRDGDDQALGGVLDMSGDYLLGLCSAGIGDPVRAEAAFSRAITTIAGNAQYQPEHMPARHWVATIARNETVNTLRGDSAALMRMPHLPPDPDHAAKVTSDALGAALKTLAAPRREALRRMWINGASYAQISHYFDIPADQTRNWVRMGLMQLQTAVWGDLDADASDMLILSAEYALGVLTPDEAGAIEEMMGIDPNLETAVAAWFRSLARLGADVAPVAVPAGLRNRSLASAPIPAPSSSDEPTGLWGLLWPAVWGVGAALIVIALLSLFG